MICDTHTERVPGRLLALESGQLMKHGVFSRSEKSRTGALALDSPGRLVPNLGPGRAAPLREGGRRRSTAPGSWPKFSFRWGGGGHPQAPTPHPRPQHAAWLIRPRSPRHAFGVGGSRAREGALGLWGSGLPGSVCPHSSSFHACPGVGGRGSLTFTLCPGPGPSVLEWEGGWKPASVPSARGGGSPGSGRACLAPLDGCLWRAGAQSQGSRNMAGAV